jgi:transcriptional regulator with XRE-family HTH domain
MTTAEKIRKARVNKNYKQEDVAGFLGISQRAYSKIETGETQIKLDRLEEISKILDVPLIDLLPSGITQQIETIYYSQVGNGKFINQKSPQEKELYEKIIGRLTEEVNYLKGLVNTLAR